MQDKVSHYAFVASAGAYKPNKVEPVLTEDDARKDSAGHVAVEKYLKEQVCRKPVSFLHATALPAGDSSPPGNVQLARPALRQPDIACHQWHLE